MISGIARPKTLPTCFKIRPKVQVTSPQSICCAERNPGPENHQIRNVQIHNLASAREPVPLQGLCVAGAITSLAMDIPHVHGACPDELCAQLDAIY